MSPAEVRLLLHIHAIAEPIPNLDAPVVEDAIEEWMEDGIIEKYDGPSSYRTTERGQMWVRMICDTPVPVQVWIDPRTKP